MASKILWAAESVYEVLSTELNDMADNALVVDASAYDNASNKFTHAAFFLFCDDFDAAPDAGGFFELHIFYRLDGVHYADGEEGDGATPVATGNSLHGIFHIAATDADQYQQIPDVPLLPFMFKAALVNMCGQDLTADDTHWLKLYPYNKESQ